MSSIIESPMAEYITDYLTYALIDTCSASSVGFSTDISLTPKYRRRLSLQDVL